MRLSPSAIALISLGVGARAFVSSPSRSGYMCKHAGTGAGTGTGRLQSCLILRSVVVEEATAPDATESLKGDVVSPGDAGAQKPGMAENAKFRCDQSVEFWRSFQEDGFWSAQENLRELGNVGTRFAQIGPEALSHWLVS